VLSIVGVRWGVHGGDRFGSRHAGGYVGERHVGGALGDVVTVRVEMHREVSTRS
jgi:hypothetical protein